MKGDIRPNHMPVNKFDLVVVGLPPLRFVTVSGIEEELQTVDLPDRTKASGGNTMPIQFTAKHPMHHLIEEAALEAWYKECQDPVSPLYKKAATLVHKSLDGKVLRTYSLIGLFISKRTLPELDMNNEGEMAVVEWQFEADDIMPI